MLRGARFSTCGRYRLTLERRWAPGPVLPFILLNPSNASHDIEDPTSRRGIGFGKREGAGGIVFGNVFGLISTSPKGLKQVDDPFGPENDDVLLSIAIQAERDDMPVICGWGVHGSYLGADRRAIEILKYAGARLNCFGRTKAGHPLHPLFLSGDQPLEDYP